MTFDQLRYFLEAARHEHIGRAARILHISPSAVSTAIRVLEDELKCPLFSRVKRKVALTPAGTALKTEVQQLVDRIQGLHAVAGSALELVGHYRVAASPFLAKRYLGPAWFHLQSETSRLTGEVCSMSTGRIVKEINSGRLDFGLCFSPQRQPNLFYEELYKGELLLAVAKTHPLLKKRKIRLSDLSKFPAILHQAAEGVDLCESHPMFERHGIEPNITCSFDDDDIAIQSLVQGSSWSLLPDIVVRQFNSTITALKHPASWYASYNVSAVFPASRSTSACIRQLVSALRSQLDR